MSSTVTTTADEIAEDTNLAAQTVDGMGLSLREAIAIANADVLADVISFDASIVGLTLDTSPNGGIDITEDLTLASGATIFHNLTTPIFEVSNGASFTSHADIVLDSSNSAQSFSQLGAVRISGTNGTFSNTGTITTDAFGPNNEDRHGSINIEGQNATVNNAAGASIISQGRYVVYSFDFDDVTNDYIPDF